MLCLFVLLLVTLQCYAQTPTPTPTPTPVPCGCTDAECPITEKLKVGSLCADELCIGGEQVAPASTDGCINRYVENGVALEARIPGCCETNTDCTAAPCTQVECRKLAGQTHGECVASRLPAKQCCTCKSDCPAQACMTVQCVPDDTPTPILVKRSDGTHYMASHHNTVMNVPGECVYTPIPDKKCCDSSEDCNTAPNACPEGQQGICDGAKTCQCLSTCKNECGTDADCPPLDTTNPNWADKTCWINACVRGFCQPKRDETIDQDEDGVLCGVDCDDTPTTGAAFGETIYCTVEPKSVVDQDDDGFVKCGSEVEALCVAPDAECPDDRVEVEKADLGPESWEEDHFTVVDNCDCCDDNQNTENPDSEVYCALDADGDNTFDCLPETEGGAAATTTGRNGGRNRRTRTPSGRGGVGNDNDNDDDCSCKEKFCVVVVGNPPTNDDRDTACQEALNNDEAIAVSASQYVRPCGDECPANDDRQEQLPYCPASVLDKNNDEKTVCDVAPSDGESPPSTNSQLEICCTQIVAIMNQPDSVVPPAEKAKYKKFADCCNSLEGPFNLPYPASTCPLAAQPLLLDVCECDGTRPDSTDCGTLGQQVTCVFDRDGDCYFDCAKPKTYCVILPVTLTTQQKQKCHIQSNDVTQLTEEQLCCLDGLEKGITTTSEERATDYDFCDCNDADKTVHEKIVCFTDEDQDGFPFCDKFYTPKCNEFCKAACPAGYISKDKLPCVSNNPVKRQAGNALDDVQKVAANHNWFNNGPPQSRSPCYDKKCEPALPTRDEECADIGDLCPTNKVLQCDCCDKDCVAYPGSPYASGSKVKCAGNTNLVSDYDYNCDKGVNKYAACDLAKVIKAKDTQKCCAGALGGDNREVFLTTTDTKVFPYDGFVTAVPNLVKDTPAGNCAVKAGDPTKCEPRPSRIGPEWDPNPVVKKRDIGSGTTDMPAFCVNKEQSEDGAASDFPFNTCASFGVNCYDSDPSPATVDCSISHDSCLKIAI